MHTGTFQEIARGESLTLEKAIDAVARTRLFEFARRQFLLHFNAEIADDTPSLIGAFDREATLIATFGLRDAGSGFFCEHYLDAPIEQVLGERLRRDVTRRQVVEVTHMCASEPGLLREVVPLLPGYLLGGGYRYLTCTATSCMHRYFARHGLPALDLAEATCAALPAEQQGRWGAYYAASPRVLAGDLHLAVGHQALQVLRAAGA